MLVTLRGLGLILHSPCIYNDYFKVLLFKFINTFLSNNNRVHFGVTKRKQKMIMVWNSLWTINIYWELPSVHFIQVGCSYLP